MCNRMEYNIFGVIRVRCSVENPVRSGEGTIKVDVNDTIHLCVKSCVKKNFVS